MDQLIKVVLANSVENPFQDIANKMDTFNSEKISIKLSFIKIADASKDLINECLKLIETNVGDYFKSSKLGWNERKKLRYLTSKNACYLIAKDEDKFAGFSMFKFNMDYARAVLYW